MRSFFVRSAVLFAFAVPLAAAACDGDAADSNSENDGASEQDIPIGDPCIPAQEKRLDFPGYQLTEVSVESGGATCSPGVCLIAHFAGRVSCPYGQPTNGIVDPTTGVAEIDPAVPLDQHCFAAGEKLDPSSQVVVPVQPQYVERSPETAVYCSCRCDGPDPKGSYCDCPTGYVCEPLVMSGGDPYEGAYCIKKGTELEDPALLVNSEPCNVTRLAPRPRGCGLDKRPGGK